ncbi:MAG: hypothetical protein A2527_03135 [Candidatus Lambdaproteobacteria bacterium RIFOXYD2_FULL_50_16]|uniref:Cyclic nucleotide-binding domain-containing protein n=1 Tax=Candidatus Lambdaproteobacteria bacterium RIFOXYD2_FULL_50_16 TaxID=1817772 RepID=A0A1F6GEN3_9PROT|nr:MAG: hypothetical protein A2527_03135 [Candidatus Lambdaproteobacteria bacterium RIFOXYD2_FULL_50_16]
MSWKNNQFYPIASVGEHGTQVAEGLLKSYPLTRSCLSVLGKKLTESVEVGFLSAQTDVIIEGEKGRDLFLLADGQVDVLVGGQKVVSMKSPALLGDKGIINSDSTRAATIKAGSGRPCLFVKIPMDRFLRDFTTKVKSDQEFAQEVSIYAAMFQTIQDRLFSYMTHQKTLWEEANGTLTLLNIKLVGKSLEKGKTKNWDAKTWEQAKLSVKKLVGFDWPATFTTNEENLYKLMAKFLGTKMLPLKQKLSPEDYEKARARLWETWMSELAKGVVKYLPKEALPIDIGEVELFNPKLYKVKILLLLRAFEKKFPAISDKHKAEDHFGSAEKINLLDLFSYLESFANSFNIPRPNYLQGMVAQKTAQIAAKSENDFNASIVRMQTFLDKVKLMAVDLGSGEVAPVKDDFAALPKLVELIFKSYDAFLLKQETNMGKRIGTIAWYQHELPTIEDLIKCTGSKSIRQNIELAYKQLAKICGLNVPGYPSNRLFYLYNAEPGDVLSAEQLAMNHWIILSPGLTLENVQGVVTQIKPGTILGGHSWMDYAGDPKRAMTVKVRAKKAEEPKWQAGLVCFPKQEQPWSQGKLDPQRMPLYGRLAQWLSDRMLGFISELGAVRDTHFDLYTKSEEVRDFETRVQAFENQRLPLNKEQWQAIVHYLVDAIGMKPSASEPQPSETIAKATYNHLLRTIKTESPELSLDEVGNRAYTAFRLHLTEMVALAKAHDPNQNRPINKTDYFKGLEDDARRIFLRIKQSVEAGYFNLATTESPAINLIQIAEDLTNFPEAFAIFVNEWIKALEQAQVKLMLETKRYQEQAALASTTRNQYNLQELQAKLVAEGVTKLRKLLLPLY